MVKYIEFDKVKTPYTVLEFRGGDEDIVVTSFTGEEMISNVVSISCESEDKIDALIASQPDEIKCKELGQNEFKTLVANSDQINSIRRQIKERIALKYSIADEIAMLKRAEDDDKRVAYQDYIDECIAFGAEVKSKVGY